MPVALFTFLNILVLFFEKQSLLLNPELTDWLDYLASEPLGSSFLLLLTLGLKAPSALLFYVGARDLNLGFQVYTGKLFIHLVFQTESHCVAQAGFELMIYLPQRPPK